MAHSRKNHHAFWSRSLDDYQAFKTYFESAELDKEATCTKFAHTTFDGKNSIFN